MKYAVNSCFSSSGSSYGSHPFSSAFRRYCYFNFRASFPRSLFFATAFLFLLTLSPVSAQSSTQLNGQQIVQRVTELVKPEVTNFATIALGGVFVLLLVRSFR